MIEWLFEFVEFVDVFDEGLVEVFDGGLETPVGFIPLADIVGEGPDLDKRNLGFAAYIVQGSAFHAFGGGIVFFVQLPDSFGFGSDFVNGDTTHFL